MPLLGGAWSKTMIGYGPEDTCFALELTYNYGTSVHVYICVYVYITDDFTHLMSS